MTELLTRRRRRRRRRRAQTPNRQRGQATVEVVLALPVVVVVLLLVVQVALVGRGQVLVTDAAREGARAAAVGASPAQVAARARATPGLEASRVSISLATSDHTVRVTVRYRTPTDVAIVGPLLGEPELRATVAMRREDSN